MREGRGEREEERGGQEKKKMHEIGGLLSW